MAPEAPLGGQVLAGGPDRRRVLFTESLQTRVPRTPRQGLKQQGRWPHCYQHLPASPLMSLPSLLEALSVLFCIHRPDVHGSLLKGEHKTPEAAPRFSLSRGGLWGLNHIYRALIWLTFLERLLQMPSSMLVHVLKSIFILMPVYLS